MQNFMPWHGLIGGALIGLAAAIYLIALGRIAGVSNILESVLNPRSPGYALNFLFLLGLPIGALLTTLLTPSLAPTASLVGDAPVLIAAGLLVGFGARIANGCTSGHGVCGLPRFSRRSIAATLTFMATAAVTVMVLRHSGLGS